MNDSAKKTHNSDVYIKDIPKYLNEARAQLLELRPYDINVPLDVLANVHPLRYDGSIPEPTRLRKFVIYSKQYPHAWKHGEEISIWCLSEGLYNAEMFMESVEKGRGYKKFDHDDVRFANGWKRPEDAMVPVPRVKYTGWDTLKTLSHDEIVNIEKRFEDIDQKVIVHQLIQFYLKLRNNFKAMFENTNARHMNAKNTCADCGLLIQ